ncbi:nonsense-mediated mRNA decay factor SMG9-like isoform X2 [Oculina patagonica]
MEDQDRGFRRGRGGRRRERGFRERPARGKGEGPPGVHPVAAAASPMKTPIILTKASADRGQETPVKQILIKPREPSQEGVARQNAPLQAVTRGKTILSDHTASQGSERSAGATPSHGMGGATASTVPASANVEGLMANMASLKLGLHSRDGAPQVVKLLDENLQWNDSALEILLDQTDFLVVGVIGPQGVGKSTVLSVLGGAGPFSDSRTPLFPVQSRQVQEDGINQTSGIDMTVTQERVILLDTQPLLSAALLDRLIHHDRNIPPEYTSPENYNEIQSLQIVTFLLTVCHVILVVQDWFTDLNIIRLLKTAEMLKPSSASHTTHESSGLGSPEESDEHYPNIVFVYNKATREDFQPDNLSSMHCVTSSLLQHSRLKLQSGISLLSSSLMPYRTLLTSCDDMNIYVVPLYRPHGGNGVCTKSPTYEGNPNFDVVLQSLRNQIFSVHRHLLTHHSLTERNWFHFAARSWETVRKSSLISEYNRLLCT